LALQESRRTQAIQSPVIPDVAALIRANPGTISLGQGVVHYGPPPQAFEAVSRFGGQISDHHYQAASGLPLLQEKLAEKLNAENAICLGEDQVIMVTAGSNMAFAHAIMAIADPGDEIVIMSPFYFNHEMAVTMANCRAVLVDTDVQYQLLPQAVEAALTPRTRAVVTISPNNPSGAVYTCEALTAINHLCRERGIYHLCDEAYEYFTYNGVSHFSAGSLPQSQAHTISLFSFSKSYGLASWRVGYMVAPHHLLRALEKVQDTVLICPPVIAQLGALGALEAGSAYCRPFINILAQTRQRCLERLEELAPRCLVPATNGAFYLLVRLASQRTPMEIVEYLVRHHKIAVIPGTAFGLHQGCYLRIAYGALEPATVATGMDRLINGLAQILD
jgi:aspartate/methionine/tyrosine aminotransferase